MLPQFPRREHGHPIVAHPCRAVHAGRILPLLPDIGWIDHLPRKRHKSQRMVDQHTVVVAPSVLDARDWLTVLVLFPGERHAVALLRQHLADDFQSDLMVAVLRCSRRRSPHVQAGVSPVAVARELRKA
jgi:hypothetical protein